MLRLLTSSLFALFLAAAGAAQAITLGFDPAAGATPIGSSVSVNLVISGLGDSEAPSLGSFDLDVLYDPAMLALTGVIFGDPVLGDQLDLFAIGSVSGFDDSVAGALNLFEISLDLAADLDALQAGSFSLVTLSFDALATGTSALDIAASLTLGDSAGDALSAGVSSGSITAVPEPAGFALVVIGSLSAILGRLRLGTARRRAAD